MARPFALCPLAFLVACLSPQAEVDQARADDPKVDAIAESIEDGSLASLVVELGRDWARSPDLHALSGDDCAAEVASLDGLRPDRRLALAGEIELIPARCLPEGAADALVYVHLDAVIDFGEALAWLRGPATCAVSPGQPVSCRVEPGLLAGVSSGWHTIEWEIAAPPEDNRAEAGCVPVFDEDGQPGSVCLTL